MIIQQSYSRKTIGKIRRRDFEVKNRNILESGKNRLGLLISISPMFQRKRRRDMTLVRLYILTVIKKVILPATILE